MTARRCCSTDQSPTRRCTTTARLARAGLHRGRPDGPRARARRVPRLRHPGWCPGEPFIKCRYNAVTFARSTDAGETFQHAPGAAAPGRCAALPVRARRRALRLLLARATSSRGTAGTTACCSSQPVPRAAPGTCLIRTQNVADPKSWRAWDGDGFNVRFVDPYRESPEPDRPARLPARVSQRDPGHEPQPHLQHPPRQVRGHRDHEQVRPRPGPQGVRLLLLDIGRPHQLDGPAADLRERDARHLPVRRPEPAPLPGDPRPRQPRAELLDRGRDRVPVLHGDHPDNCVNTLEHEHVRVPIRFAP